MRTVPGRGLEDIEQTPYVHRGIIRSRCDARRYSILGHSGGDIFSLPVLLTVSSTSAVAERT